MTVNFNSSKTLHIIALLGVLGVLLPACEEVKKENHRNSLLGASSTPTPTTSSKEEETNPQNSPSPSPSISISPQSSSPTPSVSPSANITHTPSPSPSPSPSNTTQNSDITAPTPGGDGDLTTTDVASTSVTIGWTTATDNKTNAGLLQYLCYHSLSNNLNSVSSVEANGTAFGSFVFDTDSKIITGLSSSTTYYFNVIVKDSAGNKSIYTTTTATTSDITPPTAGGSGIIAASNITATSMTLTWTAATDDVSGAAGLEYLVYRSNSNNLTTLANVENNGTATGSYSANISTKAITGLVSGRSYYFNIIVKDSAGNRSIYSTLTAATLDTAPPTIGNLGTLTATAYAADGMTINWTRGSDTVTPQSGLQYLAYYSASNDIPSVTGAEANGTAIGTYAADIVSKAVTNLSSSSTFYFTIVVRDAAGNKAAYNMTSFTTLPPPPSIANYTEAYAKISALWTYEIKVNHGSMPLSFTLPTAPSGATIDASTGVISYTPGASTGDLIFTVTVTDANNRSGSKNLTLHVVANARCLWTGAVNRNFTTAGNWVFCYNGHPASDFAHLADIIIDSNVPNQPIVSGMVAAANVAPSDALGGGTITVSASSTLTVMGYETFQSDVKVQGDSPTCTTCRLDSVWVTLDNNATLTLLPGITTFFNSWLNVGSSTSPGHLVTSSTSSDPAEWPTMLTSTDTGHIGAFNIAGTSTQQSTININGLKINSVPGSLATIFVGSYATIEKFDKVKFFRSGASTMYANAATTANISFTSPCTGVQVSDSNWTDLDFSSSIFDGQNGVNMYAIANPCTSGVFGPITLSGTGLSYGFKNDPNNAFTWTNVSSSTCTWTGAVDTSWTNPSNWSNCTNGRSNYPDQLDWVIVPVTANQPLVSGTQAMQGTAAGTGGGTITISMNSSLYIASLAADTLNSSVAFAGAATFCTTCQVQIRSSLKLGDGVTLTIQPDVQLLFPPRGTIIVGESSGRTNRAANLVVNGGGNVARYPIFKLNTQVPAGQKWWGIVVDGKASENSSVTIDGLVLSDLSPNCSAGSMSPLELNDHVTLTKLDNLTFGGTGVGTTCSNSIQVNSCTGSSLVTTWNSLNFVNSPSPGYSVFITDASCSSADPITINGQGLGYGSGFGNDPNGRLTWQ